MSHRESRGITFDEDLWKGKGAKTRKVYFMYLGKRGRFLQPSV